MNEPVTISERAFLLVLLRLVAILRSSIHSAVSLFFLLFCSRCIGSNNAITICNHCTLESLSKWCGNLEGFLNKKASSIFASTAEETSQTHTYVSIVISKKAMRKKQLHRSEPYAAGLRYIEEKQKNAHAVNTDILRNKAKAQQQHTKDLSHHYTCCALRCRSDFGSFGRPFSSSSASRALWSFLRNERAL